MKKIINIFLIITLIFSFISPLTIVSAKGTLKDEKKELADMQSKAAENNRLTTQTKNKIDAKRNAILKANDTIEANEKKVENAKVKVAESEEQVKIKTKELADVINILQYTKANSDEVYIDYVFKAETISELIERQAVVEQIINYTEEELEKLNSLIKKNEQLQVNLKNENTNLNNSITQYEKQVDELEAYIEKLASIGLDYNEQIKAKKALIKSYEDAGCKDNDKITDCLNKNSVTSGVFIRPLVSGTITQAWGHNGHSGMDIGGNKKGTKIYAPANGIVTATSYHNSCGGNIIYIRHTVGGKKYTTEYGHLTAINVKVGQVVTTSTVIGTVGGDKSTFYYDKCTTGTHLHYSVAYGWYLIDYTKWATFKTNTKATSVQSITRIKNTKGWKFSSRYT